MSEYVSRSSELLSSEDIGEGLIFERVHEHVEVKVKPCPHCGGPAKVLYEDGREGTGIIRIECQSCGISTREVETEEEAADLWNLRHENKSTGKKGAGLCAFCGGKSVVECGEDEETNDLYRVECNECGAHTGYYEDWKQCVMRWNRRVKR